MFKHWPVQTSAGLIHVFKCRQPIFERALPINMYNYRLPNTKAVLMESSVSQPMLRVFKYNLQGIVLCHYLQNLDGLNGMQGNVMRAEIVETTFRSRIRSRF